MLDNMLRFHKDRLLEPPSRSLECTHPILISMVGLGVGLVGLALLSQQYYGWGLFFWLLNRLLDGLDGSVARKHEKQSDLGGYVDILADYVVYAGVPVALMVGAPSTAAYLSLAVLLSSFYLNSASWMYLAAILEKRSHGARARGELTTVTMPSGLIGGAETIAFYCLFILLPAYLPLLFSLMAGLVLVTASQRLVWASRHLT